MSFLAFLTRGFELPNWITPTIAGLTVGAVVGVAGFVAVLLFVGREKQAPRRRVAAAASPDNVVHIPPYTTLPRETPVPAPWMGQEVPASAAPVTAPSPVFAPPTYRPGSFAIPTAAPVSAPAYSIPAVQAPIPAAPPSNSMIVSPTRGAPPLRPSTELSARVFAKMGYAVEAPPSPAHPYAAEQLSFDAPSSDPDLELDESELQPEEELAVNHPVMVSPVMIVAAAPSQETLVLASSPLVQALAAQAEAAEAAEARAKVASQPAQPAAVVQHPLVSAPTSSLPPQPPAVVHPTSSAMRMKAASISDLDLEDDALTNVREPLDERATTQMERPAAAKKAVSIADLDFEDNGATQICETIFDEPPQPRRRSEPPKIRPKNPSPPRFPAAKDANAPTHQVRPRSGSGAALPRVTTPAPGKVRQA